MFTTQWSMTFYSPKLLNTRGSSRPPICGAVRFSVFAPLSFLSVGHFLCCFSVFHSFDGEDCGTHAFFIAKLAVPRQSTNFLHSPSLEIDVARLQTPIFCARDLSVKIAHTSLRREVPIRSFPSSSRDFYLSLSPPLVIFPLVCPFVRL